MRREISIDQHRREVLQKIEEDVFQAYCSRRLVTLNEVAQTDDDTVEEKVREKERFQKVSDDTVIYAEGDLQPWQAAVSHSHDYGSLLASAFRILIEDGVLSAREYTPDKVRAVIKDYLKHEYEHHVPGIGHEGLTALYCVEFMEDKAKKLIGFRPLILWRGQLTLGLYKDIITAPEHLSAVDRVYSTDA